MSLSEPMICSYVVVCKLFRVCDITSVNLMRLIYVWCDVYDNVAQVYCNVYTYTHDGDKIRSSTEYCLLLLLHVLFISKLKLIII